MTSTPMLTVFCYDISDHKLRRKVAKIFENSAVRVQHSVFEAWVDENGAKKLAERAAQWMDEGDSIRVYAVGQNGMRRSMTFGPVPFQTGAGYFLV